MQHVTSKVTELSAGFTKNILNNITPDVIQLYLLYQFGLLIWPIVTAVFGFITWSMFRMFWATMVFDNRRNTKHFDDVLRYIYEQNRDRVGAQLGPNKGHILAPGRYWCTIDGKWVIVHYWMSSSSSDLIGNHFPFARLTLHVLTRTDEFFKRLVSHAEQKHGIAVYQHVGNNFWNKINGKFPRRSWSNTVISKGNDDKIQNALRRFRDEPEIYSDFQIPYRLVYLLEGKPGTGKTTVIKAIATQEHMNLCTMSLSEPRVTDNVLMQAVQSIPENSILVLEDIDCVFQDRAASAPIPLTRSTPAMGDEMRYFAVGPGADSSTDSNTKVTLSGILNMLDGIGSSDGLIVFMTTNYPERLDAALVREERVHCRVHFDHKDPALYRQMFLRFYGAKYCDDEETERIAEEKATAFCKKLLNNHFTMAQLQNYFMRYLDDPDGAINGVKDLISRSR